ncbi:hypothetical protein JNW88_03930 [Micromonospora sp. ATA32]|nr:hypothetical protein [Micromonospora sp. ATA32]
MSAPIRRRGPLVRRGALTLLLLTTSLAGCARPGATGAGAVWDTPAPTARGAGECRCGDDECGGDANAEQPVRDRLLDAETAPVGRSAGRLAAAPPPAPAARATPAPEFPRGYTLLSQTCTLQVGQQVYVSRSGKTKGNFRFCTQRLRKNDTGGFYLNPYVFVEPFFLDGGRWLPDSREPLSLTITCRVIHAGEQDYSLTATSPSGNGPGHTASCGRLVPHAVTATTGSDAYTIRFTGYTSGGHYGVLAFDTEVHFPGAGKPTPEQQVTVPR